MPEPWPEPDDCMAFDEASAELALGLLDADVADRLLAHAGRCDRCRSELDSLSSTADRLTLLAPEAEPPAGFERKALAAMGARPSVRRSRRTLALVAAAVLIAVAGGVAVGRFTGPSGTTSAVVSGVLTDGSGQSRGFVSIIRGDDPHLVMSLSGVDPGETYHCAVRTADGRTTEVAAWNIGSSGGGTWKVPIDPSLAGATTALVTGDSNSPVATASLT